ncbi:isoleucine--tRNA ligase, cytoplasmic-like [Anneissia japonica]|uniref:isoleucine--tRNA ligase, cytoplasmic-like n=1 Tax=Anneissia japonica TaxID=1529436 RepID=UPI0014255D57|nr:isoleucine--tRNA ligase, cytoplasmic-like [Anneissia japonica]XP_033114616.1 isoleucine--tRNA ligase, cytoplasmic-like [Anneissia japonica]
MVEAVPDHINFPKEEEKILELWKAIDAFNNCLKQSKGKPRYSFYDGPPFATGLPHYGHILAGTIKDIVTRYAHQNGFHVERRFGWDCHGLPVEYEIDKKLGITGPEDVMKMGITNYNKECRQIVMRYSSEWEFIVNRLGRWIDFKNDYKTMYPWFMETIWWVFKQLFEKGLVYRGFKVMPFSTACSTPLSNFESGQNYKDVVDPAVIVNFPLDDDPNVSVIAWTTTPWTLPSNLALCVHPQLDYVKIKHVKDDKVYIMMEARLGALFKKENEYEILERFKGSTLKGKKYKPLFNYFLELKKTGAFTICNDTYVTEDSGTGVVHQAAYFGADDYRVCLEHGVITKEMIVCPVDESGKFTQEVTDFAGQYVKDADKNIIRWLKQNGRLVDQSTYKHSYPFCWRSETPLIYKAVPSWFIRVEPLVEKLLANNQKTYWVPEFVKEKRFANWLRDARDWAVSRNRYWGTPIPLWVSEDLEEVVCIGSIQQLEELSGHKVTDLHRENVDGLTIPSKRPGHPPLKRVSEVFDCWFESGSMPYAQQHYPFEHKREFEDCFPADFIAEGIDQTRGWFYTLLVLSTALFDEPPFKNLIANGLVLASDGQKMSKRKKNYPDPLNVVDKYGADALRLYLINSPVVRAESLRFKESGVKDVLKDVFLPWYNAYRFLIQNVQRFEIEDSEVLMFNEDEFIPSGNFMDKWILSFTQSLIKFVRQEMAAYRLYTVIPQLVKFVDKLTNWYVRSNRKRIKGEGGVQDCRHALETLFMVLFSMVKVMAPFTPFLTELIYQNLRKLVDPESTKGINVDSVHYLMIPKPREDLINPDIERAVARMQSTIELGRVIRDRKTMPTKYPLREVVVIHPDEQCLKDVTSLEQYILEELNIRSLTTSQDQLKYGVSLKAEPDSMVLGKRLKGSFKAVSQAIRELTNEQLKCFRETGEIDVLGHKLGEDDLRLTYTFAQGVNGATSKYEAHSDNEILVLLDVTPDQSMLDEGIAREVINRIQKLRKKAGLQPVDKIGIFYDVEPSTASLASIIPSHSEYIFNTIKQPLSAYPPTGTEIITETTDLKGTKLKLTIVRRDGDDNNTSSTSNDVQVKSIPKPETNPACRYINLMLCNAKPETGSTSCFGSLLLENPKGESPIGYDVMKQQVQVVFGLRGKVLKIYKSPDQSSEFVSSDLGNLDALSGSTLYVFVASVLSSNTAAPVNATSPLCRFVNVELHSKSNTRTGTVLLENPQENFAMEFATLRQQVDAMFSLAGKPVTICQSNKKEKVLTCDSANDVLSFHGTTLHAFV